MSGRRSDFIEMLVQFLPYAPVLGSWLILPRRHWPRIEAFLQGDNTQISQLKAVGRVENHISHSELISDA